MRPDALISMQQNLLETGVDTHALVFGEVSEKCCETFLQTHRHIDPLNFEEWVTRQYCGQVGKQENCRVAVSLSVATWSSSLPIAYRLYLPKEWAEDSTWRKATEVPKEVEFQTKPEIALDQIR